jgi:methyltransferase-like protein/2-polyprenyl-3-methyl-5-hydroxy-6-metoxy-1,4-benzoquinol methylase
MSITRTKAEKKTTNEKDTAMPASTSATNGPSEVNGSSEEQVVATTETASKKTAKVERTDEANGAAAAANIVAEPVTAPIDAAASAAPTEESYDEVPYPGGTYRATHPSHLAMVARLCGISPAAPTQCRVLELGGSMGANIIPMAADLPHSEFIGIDLSAKQVSLGKETIAQLGLKNIELRHCGINDVDESFGKFDYIICHGVYSWVPPEVQRGILDVGRKLLTPNGVLYVSYNTYPGWHLRGVVREMMRYHVAAFESPQQKIRQARGLLDFLVKSARSRSQAYASLLKEEAEILDNRLDSYIYHEHLEEYNEPVYFHEFVKRVDAAGLRYLADAAISSMVAQMFDESTAELLKDVPLLRREQYMDFLRSRMFRCSLLCHQYVAPNYRMASHNLTPLHVALQQPLESKPGEKDGEVIWRHSGGQVTTQKPITKAIERLNRAYPSWLAVQELLDEVDEDTSKGPLLDALMMSFIRGLMQVAEAPPYVSPVVTEKPTVTPLARFQAKRGSKISSRMHTDYVFQPQQRFLIEHLDGTRTAEDLAELLRSAVKGGRFKVSREGADVSPEDLQATEIVKGELERLRALSMLVG